MQPSTGKTKNMILISLFAVLIAICAWISIPAAIPFTMQTFGVFLTVGVLGGKKGTAAICIYLLLGIIGLPVYAGGASGIGVILSNVGGYMIGWIFTALIMWAVEKLLGRKTWMLALSMFLGLIACYALGTIWFVAVYIKETGPIGAGTALTWCVIPFIIPDLIKLGLALAVRKQIMRYAVT